MKTLEQHLQNIDNVPFYTIPKGSLKGLDFSTLKKADKNILYKKIRESHKKFPVLDHTCLECAVCGYRAKQLGMHVVSHGMTSESYQSEHGDVVSQESKDRVKGENNPAFNHGGKYSPYSKKFIKYQDGSAGYSVADVVQKANKTKEDNPERQPTRIEYYLEKGLNEYDARNALSERQRTFSLQICIEKYGLEEGYVIWKERNDAWDALIKSKSVEERMEIDRKKAPKHQYSNLINGGKSLGSGTFYVIESGGIFKIGITSKTVETRYGKSFNYRVVYRKTFESILTAFSIEQRLKYSDELRPFRINRGEAHPMMGWTECFRIEEDKLLSLVEKVEPLVVEDLRGKPFVFE